MPSKYKWKVTWTRRKGIVFTSPSRQVQLFTKKADAEYFKRLLDDKGRRTKLTHSEKGFRVT